MSSSLLPALAVVMFEETAAKAKEPAPVKTYSHRSSDSKVRHCAGLSFFMLPGDKAIAIHPVTSRHEPSTLNIEMPASKACILKLIAELQEIHDKLP